MPRKEAANYKVLVYYPHSSPPQRRGQGWWFAIPRSSAAGDKNASQTPYKHRLAHASGSRPLAFRAGVPVRGFLGRSPKPLLGTFGGAKVSPRRIGVQTKSRKRLCDADRRKKTKSKSVPNPPIISQTAGTPVRPATAAGILRRAGSSDKPKAADRHRRSPHQDPKDSPERPPP